MEKRNLWDPNWDPRIDGRNGIIETRMAGERAASIQSAYARLAALENQLIAGLKYEKGRELISAGHAVEALLGNAAYKDLIDTAQESPSYRQEVLAPHIAEGSKIPASFVSYALEKYGLPNNLIAHYRHPAAPPNRLTPTGLFITAEEDGTFRAQSVAGSQGIPDRQLIADGFNGRERRAVELWSDRQLLSEIASRSRDNWYSAFVDPIASTEIGLPVLPYNDGSSGNFVSWSDRVGGR